MACSHEFSVTPRKRRIIDQNLHANCWRIDVDELKWCALLAIGQCFADENVLKASDPNDVTGVRLLYLNLL